MKKEILDYLGRIINNLATLVLNKILKFKSYSGL